jgi:hypothetical protein
MIQPRHGIIDCMNRSNQWRRRPSQQDDRQLQRACGRYFAVGRLAAAVLGHQYLDSMAVHELALSRFGERSAVEQVLRRGNGQRRLDWIDASNQIVMLGRRRERCDFLPADRKQNVARFAAKSIHGSERVIGVVPTITGYRRPGWTAQRNNRCAALTCGLNGVSRHGCRIGVRGVDEGDDLVVTQIPHQAFGAAESPTSRRHRLGMGIAGDAGQGQCHGDFGARSQRLPQLPRFSRAPQYQDVSSHVAR